MRCCLAGAEDALFSEVREKAESMIAWAKSGRAMAMEYGPPEQQVFRDGMELMRLLAQAHLDLRALREQRRGDVTDADGDGLTASASSARPWLRSSSLMVSGGRSLTKGGEAAAIGVRHGCEVGAELIGVCHPAGQHEPCEAAL